MYSEEELFRGLRKAHEAGDTRAATLFANKIAELRKSKTSIQQTSQQQTPIQQTPVQQTTVNPQKEEPGLLEGVKTFLFGDEDKKPKAELISEKFLTDLKPEDPYDFSKTNPINLLDKEYNQKIKDVEDKYSKLSYRLDERTGYPIKNTNIDLDLVNKQKQQEIFNLNVERFRKQGRNLTPVEQERETITYTDNINKNKTIIENKAKEKKSYLEELSKEDKTDSPNFISSWKKVINTVRNTWDYNSKVDDDISKAETLKNNNQKFLDFVGKGVNPFKNREYNNGEDMIDAGSYIDPSIASDAKKAIETQEEITTKIVPTAEIKEDEQSRRLRRNFPLNSFITIKEFKGLTAEQFKRNALEKAYNLAAQNLDNELTPLYDKIQSEIGIPKSEVARKIDTYLTFQNEREQGLYPNIGKLSENDIKLFNNPNFKNIADTYRKTAIPQIVEGKKRVLSLANVDIYNQEKANAFGTINQVENIGRKEAIRTAILDKNVEEQGILSEDGYNKLLYNTAWFSSKFNDFTINQTAAAFQIGTQAVTGAFTGKVYTPEWTENIINTTDLLDNLTQQDSHFKLSIFKDDKYIDRTLPSGDIVKVQYTPEGDIINAFGGDMEYTINNPEIMQWLANDFEANKEEIVANGKSLWETEGGKAVFLENVWNSMAPEMVEEMPSLLVGATAGRIAKALISGSANERRLAQGAEYMINVASNMTEQYPSIYKKYQEAAQDKDNPFPALATSGALAFATLFTSTLQSKAIGLTGNDINKVIMPEAIEASSEAVKIINKQFAKIPDVTLREKLTNAAINKVMFKNIMSSAAKVLTTSAKVGGQEATEEVILEPLVNAAANFINEKITGDRAYNQETLKDLNFLNPDVAITSFFTGSTLSQGMDIVKSMSTKGPFSKEDYLKTAFENEATFTSMVDIMTQSGNNNFSEENQAKMMADYKALKDSYNARKSELGVNDEALATLNFANPVIKSFVNSIGETEKSLNKVNSGRTFDNAIIRQSLNERELAEKKIALDEEAAKGNVSVSPEGTYRTVGSNPLTEELGKQISEYEQLQLSNNNLTTFIDTFNKETKPVQKQYIQELNQVTSEAPDLIYAKNSKEGDYAYKAVSNAIMDKQMAMSQLEKVNAEIETAVIDGTDTKELQVQKQNLEKAIKASDKTITTLKKQYKAGRVNTQNETIKRFNEFRTASLVLQDKLESMAGVDATDEEIEQSEINDAYADYLDAFKALKKSNSTLKKEYGVEVLDSKYTPISLEEFQTRKNNIKEKNTLSKKLSENKGTLGDVERLIGLEYATRAKRIKDRVQVTTPKNKEEIKAILDDKEQVYEYAKRLGFNNKKSYAQTKKAVRTYLNKQLSTQDETRLEGVSAVFVEKTPRQVNGNPMFEVEGALYKPAGYSVSPTMMTQEERNTVLTNAVISEIAKQVFNNSLLLTPYNVSQIINKVIIESGFDTEVGIDNRSLQFIAETILALKADLDAKGSSYKFNDDVVISKLSDDTERGYEGMATTPILTVVDTEGNVHLIDFKSFSAGNYAAASSGWSNTLTEIQAIFQDNGITVASINVLPIRVNNTSTTENGLTNLVIGKTSFNTIPNNDNPISRTLLQLATSEPILTTLEEEGLLTKEEVESFNDIPLDETDTPITPADKLKEDSLVVLETETPTTTEGAVSGQATVTATEKNMKAEDKNKHTKDTPKEVMEEETPEGVFAGLGKGVYIQVKYIQAKETKNDFYMIKIFGDTDLANRYGKKKMSLEDLKLVYEANNWFAPKSFEPKDPKKLSTYQLRYADTLTPVLSKNYVEFVQPNGFNEVINDITVAADLIGTEVEIVENNESGYNDTNEVQKDFKTKASLSIVNENGEKIAVVPPNSPLRENLKITNKNGLNRLQPTIATIKDIKFNNFNRKTDELFSEWEKKALASGVLVPGEYEMVYIGMENKRPVFKNQNGVVVPGRVPKDPKLGSAYLFITNFPTKNIMIPMGTPKLAELGYTIQDLKPLLALIDINEITKNEANAESIYSNFIAQLDALVRDGKLKDPKLKDLQFLLSSELGGQELTLRASSTQSNIDKLDTIGVYKDKEDKEGILISFLLDRIITMNDETLGSHSIDVNPNILFADNALVLDNIKPKPKAKKQILSSTASQPINTTIISELLNRLKETGLANEVFEMTNDEIEEKLIELGVDAETAKQVIAYHGSPYSFERFTNAAIGTGEGAQSFGWGLYFTDLENIAKNYANNQSLIEKHLNIEYDYNIPDRFYQIPKNNRKTKEDIIEYVDSQIQGWQDRDQYQVQEWTKLKQKVSTYQPNLYKVSLHKGKTLEQYTWLEWDSPITEDVKRIFEKIGFIWDFEKTPLTQGKAYANFTSQIDEKLKDRSAAQRQISLLLLENGIDGVKFPSESISRGATSETAEGFNYVVFDENAITIEEQIKFQKTLSSKGISLTTAGFVYNGDVYLNIDNMNLDTPVHEFGHLWLSWAKSNLAEAYARGLELAKSDEAEPYRQYVMETQPDLEVDSEAFLEEVLAQAIGDNGAKLVEENSAETKSWLQGLWDAIGKMLGISELVANGGYKTLTLNDYAKAVAVDLLKGENFTGKDGKENFARWKGNNKLVNGAQIQDVKTGEPIVAEVYHGTTNEFYEFDASVKGNIEGHLGKVNYFTSDMQDANANYLSEGADITGRVSRRSEYLEDYLFDEYGIVARQSPPTKLKESDYEKISKEFGISVSDLKKQKTSELYKYIAEKELKGSTEQVLDLYVKLNNPVVLGKGSTWFETLNVSDSDLDQAAQEIADENDITLEEAKDDYQYDIEIRAIENTGYENLHVEALRDALESNGYDGGLASDILGDNYYERDVDLNKLEKDLRKAELYDNAEGEMASGQVIADFFKNLGFDGVILTDVSERFKNMGLGSGTSHIHVFDDFNNQIKLADGSNVTFGETPDIRFQIVPTEETTQIPDCV
jgi:hypothetical protein